MDVDSPHLLDNRQKIVMLLARNLGSDENIDVEHDNPRFGRQEFVPAVKDPSWQPLTAALLVHILEADRTIDEIVVWGSSQGHTGSLIRHMLAYLSFQGKVHYAPAEAVWRLGPEPDATLPSKSP